MSTETMNIALFADVFNSRASGAKVSQHVAKTWLQRGHNVTVYTFRTSDFDVGLSDHPRFNLEVLDGGSYATFHHLKRPSYFKDFETKVRTYGHDVVHFLSFGYHKSRFLLEAAKNGGARTITQEFSYKSYCAEGKDALDHTGPCGKCMKGNFWNAIRHQCGKGGIHRPIEAFSRRQLRRKGAPMIDAAIATCSYMKNSLHQWGIPKERIYRSPLPFDRDSIEIVPLNDSDYWVFSGLFIHEKGADHAERLAATEGAPKLYCLLLINKSNEKKYASFLKRMKPQIESGKLVADHEIRYHTGGKEIVENSFGFYLPTVWPSSTEYTLMEAMGMGKPLVAFNTGVQVDILRHRHNAMVYEVGDQQGVCDAMNEIARDQSLKQSLSKNVRQTYEQVTDPDLLIECLTQAYQGTDRHAYSGFPDFTESFSLTDAAPA